MEQMELFTTFGMELPGRMFEDARPASEWEMDEHAILVDELHLPFSAWFVYWEYI